MDSGLTSEEAETMAVAQNARMVLVSGFVVERTSKGHGSDNGQKDNPTDDDDVQMFVNS